MPDKDLDLLFVHVPANIEDSKPTLDADVDYTDQFVSFPTGFFNMGHNLEKAGYKTRILNLGERVHNSQDKDIKRLVEEFIEEHNPKIIGIDCHWMIHSAGAIKTAELIKKYSPDTKVILGGYTASHFAEEILEKYDAVDFVMKGQCDDSIVDIIRELHGESRLDHVPSLVYRDRQGQIRTNKTQSPNVRANLEITRYDLLIDRPTVNPDRALITMYRGCNKLCNYCTGNYKSFTEVMGAEGTYIIDPETVVSLIKKNKEKGRNKIYLYGDIRRGGQSYVDKFFSRLEESGVSDVHIVFEFFTLATEDYVAKWGEWADKHNCTLEATFSPESGNQEVRKQYHKGHFTNDQIKEHCQLVADYGIPQSTYFMLGIPKQTSETVQETLELADELVRIYASRFKTQDLRHDVLPYTFMQIPDGGSEIFRFPKKFGYRFNFNGFEGLVNKLANARHWTDAVGFETEHFTREELIETYFHIQRTMRTIYHKHGLLSNTELQTELKNLDDDKKVYRAMNSNQT